MGIRAIEHTRTLNSLESQAVELAVKRGVLATETCIEVAIGSENGKPFVAIGQKDGSHVVIPMVPKEDAEDPAETA